jgi:alginate O-acetyltransferase complex protein AlgI
MSFTSPTFILLFLPIFLILSLINYKGFRNIFLIFASIIFYGWGEPKFVVILIFSILINYCFSSALNLALKNSRPPMARVYLGLAITFNLALLLCFKYASFLIVDITRSISGWAGFNIVSPSVVQISLPLGISFFTFSAISYLIDIYRRQAKFEKNPIAIALYITFFPKLLAGPIVKYRDMAEQITNRKISLDKIAYGVQRFIIGLGKKILIANTLGPIADQIFALTNGQLTTSLAWLGIICFTLQIYFDFSGYSDMAIGIGRISGFDFLENFNYPYISKSVREFWRRWHISLSTWFRDYLYIPLGGNRVSTGRVYMNLMIVFILCGLWHGNGWTFLIWGAWHGCFLVLEHTQFGKFLDKSPFPVNNIYALLIIMVGWVLFRSDNLYYAVMYLKAMFGFAGGDSSKYFVATYLNNLGILTLIAGLILAVLGHPIFPKIINNTKMKLLSKGLVVMDVAYSGYYFSRLLFLGAVLFGSFVLISGSSNNPFIYFKF